MEWQHRVPRLLGTRKAPNALSVAIGNASFSGDAECLSFSYIGRAYRSRHPLPSFHLFLEIAEAPINAARFLCGKGLIETGPGAQEERRQGDDAQRTLIRRGNSTSALRLRYFMETLDTWIRRQHKQVLKAPRSAMLMYCVTGEREEN